MIFVNHKNYLILTNIKKSVYTCVYTPPTLKNVKNDSSDWV